MVVCISDVKLGLIKSKYWFHILLWLVLQEAWPGLLEAWLGLLGILAWSNGGLAGDFRPIWGSRDQAGGPKGLARALADMVGTPRSLGPERLG